MGLLPKKGNSGQHSPSSALLYSIMVDAAQVPSWIQCLGPYQTPKPDVILSLGFVTSTCVSHGLRFSMNCFLCIRAVVQLQGQTEKKEPKI